MRRLGKGHKAMTVKKTNDGWIADVRPNGATGKRYRKRFTTKGEAIAYEAWLKSNSAQKPDWQPQKRDSRRLSELIEVWYSQHGTHLNSGKDTYSRLKNLCAAIGNPAAHQ